MLRQNHAIHARTIAGPQNRTEISRICHAIDCDQEGLLLRRRTSNEVSEIRFGEFLSKCDHALWGLAASLSLEFTPRNFAHWYALITGQLEDVAHHRILVKFLRNEDLVHASPSRKEEFTHCLTPLDLRPTKSLVIPYAARCGASLWASTALWPTTRLA
jgi:hypothetical protein